MLTPKPIPPGGHIRIVSPGLSTLTCIPDRARRADQALRSLGFEISYGPHAFSTSAEGTAGSVAERAADFMDAFGDDSVDAILSSDAGIGSREMVSMLDARTIAANAKPFIGYCDNIFLHQYLASEAKISSLYGCVLMVHFGEVGGAFPETIEYFRRTLTDSSALVCQPLPSRTAEFIDFRQPELDIKRRVRDVKGGWTWLRPGRAHGTLVGGELSMLPDVISDFNLSLDETVLFWDIAMFNRHLPVRPMFEALINRVDLSRLSGMIVGIHPWLAPTVWAQTVDGLLRDALPGATFPVLANADLSHLCPSWIVPYGEDVTLDDESGVVFPRTAGAVASRPASADLSA